MIKAGKCFKKRGILMKYISSTLMDENGQSLIEYGLIISLIAIVAVSALILLGTKVSHYYEIDISSSSAP